MTYGDARASACSSCKAKADKSNYWVPQLYVHAKNGTFHSVANSGATIYYLQRTQPPNEKIIPFPEGFKMLAGDTLRRSYNPNSVEDKATSFVCLGGNVPQGPAIPNSKCPDGLRAQIVMPSCWDGKNLDSPDHKSHMAYPDGTDHGKCPSTHPKRFMTLFYEFIYDAKSWDSEWVDGKHPFVFANGDPTGYGYHGDFVNGWDIPTLEKAIQCNADSGVIEECGALQLYENDEMDDCKISPSVKDNLGTDSWLNALPGCNPLQRGPNRAVLQTNCGATTTIGKPETYSIDATSKGFEYVGCAGDDLNARTFPYRYGANDMTVFKCIGHCASKGYIYAGLEWAVECWCGNTLAQSKLNYMTCTTKCAGNSSQYCGGPQKLSVYKKEGSSKKPMALKKRRSNVHKLA